MPMASSNQSDCSSSFIIPYIAEYKASPNIRRPVFFQLYYQILPIPTGCLALLPIKAVDVETNPCPTTTHKHVWIYDI